MRVLLLRRRIFMNNFKTNMEDNCINRRDFLKGLGAAGLGVLAATSPWLSAFSEVKETEKNVCRLGVIGPGSRGQFLMGFIAKNPKADIVALADIYQPSLDAAKAIAPKAKTYKDYRKLLDDKSIDAVLVSTPLNTHFQIVMNALDAGKHVYCEKSIGFDMRVLRNVQQTPEYGTDFLYRATEAVRSALHKGNGSCASRNVR